MSKYKVTLYPYKYADMEHEGETIRLEFNQPRDVIENLVCPFLQENPFEVHDPLPGDDTYFTSIHNDSCLLKFYFTRKDHRLVDMGFFNFNGEEKELAVRYNDVQLIGKQLKQVMSELEPFQLKYYISEPYIYMTSTGLTLYINNQLDIPEIDEKWESKKGLSCDSIEHLLHCPINGCDIESGFFNTQTPDPDWWCVFDTTKDTWYDCPHLRDVQEQ